MLLHLVSAISMGCEDNYHFNYNYSETEDEVQFFSNIVSVSCISFICQRKIVLGIWHGYYIQKRRRRKFLFKCMIDLLGVFINKTCKHHIRTLSLFITLGLGKLQIM